MTVDVTVQSAQPEFAVAPTPGPGPAHPFQEVLAGVGPADLTPVADAVDYQWNLDGKPVKDFSGWGASYSPDPADVGKQLTVTVTARKAGYRVGRRTSAPGRDHLDDGPQTPVVSGLTAGTDAYTYEGYWGAGTTFTYRWFADGVQFGSDWIVIIPDSAIGKRLTVEVTGTRNGEQQTRTSPASDPVAGKVLTSASPVVTGAAYVGETLTGSTGTWTAGSLHVQVARRARRQRRHRTTYALTGSDVGKTITFEVSGTRSGYTPVTRTSVGKGPVAYRQLTTAAPSLTGTPEVGRTLTVTAGTWTTGTTFGYRWLADGSAISGATGTSYVLTSADVGRTVTVEVTGTKTNSPPRPARPRLGPVVAVAWAPKTPTFPAPRVGKLLTVAPATGAPA